jgi:hypothetical protein
MRGVISHNRSSVERIDESQGAPPERLCCNRNWGGVGSRQASYPYTCWRCQYTDGLLPQGIEPLIERQAVELRPSQFGADCQSLIRYLSNILAEAEMEMAAEAAAVPPVGEIRTEGTPVDPVNPYAKVFIFNISTYRQVHGSVCLMLHHGVGLSAAGARRLYAHRAQYRNCSHA